MSFSNIVNFSGFSKIFFNESGNSGLIPIDLIIAS